MLPAIENYICKRPDSGVGRGAHYIPQESEQIFWGEFFERLREATIFDNPVPDIVSSINPYFGFFGFRFHPNTKQSRYFHVGVSSTQMSKTLVLPVCDGVLEYSGFDVVNGFYVFLSHPHIQTEDGYVMHSLYMHLKKPLVKFSSYQKMLREISFNAYPKIMIERGTSIGEVGATGVVDGKHHHLHLQIEFRHPHKERIVMIDPLVLFGARSQKNLTADFKTTNDFESLYKQEKEGLKELKIDKYFE